VTRLVFPKFVYPHSPNGNQLYNLYILWSHSLYFLNKVIILKIANAFTVENDAEDNNKGWPNIAEGTADKKLDSKRVQLL